MANKPVQNSYEIFVTCVDNLGPLLVVWGQTDRETSMFVERLLKDYTDHFDKSNFIPDFSCLAVNTLVCAKYKDGQYYRAQIVNNRQLAQGKVDLKFIDYGNVDQIDIENIRIYDNVPLAFTSIKAQAIDFILGNVINKQRGWDEATLARVRQDICYMELPCSILGVVNNYRFVKIMYHHRDLGEYLVEVGIAAPVTLTAQESMLRGARMVEVAPMGEYVPAPALAPAPAPVRQSVVQVREICNYKSIPLEKNSEHMVYVSYVEDGPYLFSVQLQSCEEALEKLMTEINQTNLLPLTEPPIIGAPCMARCMDDGSICRAVVVNLVEEKCKIFYVDFGNTDIVPFSDIYQIPFKYILPKAMSMRFTLAGLKNINITNEKKCAFKEYVTNKLLKLKVLNVDGLPCIRYCELYDAGRSVIDILYESKYAYQTIPMTKGMKKSVIVSFIEGCKRFFVRLKECSESLTSLMLALARVSESALPVDITEVKPGLPCLAVFPGDGQWYRARITGISGTTATVRYVDYGNEESVPVHCLKRIDQQFVGMMPEQAIECCLYGYQNMSFNNDIESVFESLTLENEFTMRVISKQNNDVLLVDLFDGAGNNVAALLIERLAAHKSQIGPLPASQLARSILSPDDATHSSDSEKSFSRTKSPKADNDNWRHSNHRQFKPPAADTKSWRNSSDKKSWRTNDEPQPGEKSPSSNWNGDVSSGKHAPRSDRPNSRNARKTQPFDESNGRPERGTVYRRPHDESQKHSGQRKSFERHSPRESANWHSGSESEKSWSGNSGGNRSGRSMNSQKRLSKPYREEARRKTELPPQDLAPLDAPYAQLDIPAVHTDQVCISWFYDPENFFCQLLASQKEFREMMMDIQSAYQNRPPLNSMVPVGSSVVAEFHEDSILYRTNVLEVLPPNLKVQYVDFGNISIVSTNKIWQIETKFLRLPAQAVRCAISGVKAAGDSWPVCDDIDKIFNKDQFTCTFENVVENKYEIQLYSEDISVKQQLVEAGLAIDTDAPTDTSTTIINDEPIELRTLLSQFLSVRISFVLDFHQFYVFLQQPKADEIILHINTYMQTADSAMMYNCSLEQLAPGCVCVVQVDGFWYRALILEVQSPELVQVRYPDTGALGTHSVKELYFLPGELCVFSYQAYQCSLVGVDVDTGPLSTGDFKQLWECQDAIIYVDSIEGDVLKVQLYSVAGEQVQIGGLQGEALRSVALPLPLPVYNSRQQMWVSHVQSANCVYLQRNIDAEPIEQLLSSLFQYYEAEGDAVAPAEGLLCCVRSSDNNWYRALVHQVLEDAVLVFYIDYGNTETVDMTHVKQLEPQFLQQHKFALPVSLDVDEDSDDLTQKLIEITDGKMFSAQLTNRSGLWVASLNTDEWNVAEKLTEMRADAESTAEPVAELASAPVSQPALVEADDSRAQIIITHIDSPSEFYVQPVANESSIAALQADLQERVESLSRLEGADVGVLCAAKYSVDEQWYRAEVLDADADITTVRFVDYGNTDVIDNHTSELKTLPAELLAINKYARLCSLNIRPAKDEEWAQEACEIFETAMSAHSIYADIVYQDEKARTYVDLYVDGENIADRLLDAQLAVPIVRNRDEQLANNTGFISHLNSPAEFWIQLESSVPDLENIADRLTTADTFPDLQDLSPGMLCAANFPDDEMWYRARILSNTVAGVEVLFIDYGNSSTAMNLKVLPEDLVQMPALAQKCSLNKPAGISEWSEQATAKFQEISADGMTVFSVKKLTPGETSVVELFVDGCSVAEQLPGELSYVDVRVTDAQSPANFTVQRLDDAQKIDEINECLASANSFAKITDWDAARVYAALRSASGRWYRARVMGSAGDCYHAFFIDYGGTDSVLDVRIIPPSLEAIPPLAIQCSLEAPPGGTAWTGAVCAKFVETFGDGSPVCQLQFLDKSTPCTVRLYHNGINIYDEFCAIGEENAHAAGAAPDDAAQTLPQSNNESVSEETARVNEETTLESEIGYSIVEEENLDNGENEHIEEETNRAPEEQTLDDAIESGTAASERRDTDSVGSEHRDVDRVDASELPVADNVDETELRHADTVEETDLRHTDTVQETELRHSDIVEENDLRHADTVQENDLRHADTVQEDDLRHADIVQETELQHTDTVQETDLRHADTVQETDLRHADTVEASNDGASAEDDTDRVNQDIPEAVMESSGDISELSETVAEDARPATPKTPQQQIVPPSGSEAVAPD